MKQFKKIYVIIAFNPYYVWPPPAANWPDDGRSLWKDASAQDELVQAWTHLAKRFKDNVGILFYLLTEPHGITPDEIQNDHALPKQVWNTLYPRLVDAIRAEDSDRWILTTPIWGFPMYIPDLVAIPASRLIYTFHFYAPPLFHPSGDRRKSTSRNGCLSGFHPRLSMGQRKILG